MTARVVRLTAWAMLYSLLALPALALAAASATQPERVFPGETWTARSPAELGLDQTKLQEFVTRLQGASPDKSSGAIIRHGYLAMSWGRQEWRYGWASSSKPMLSTLLFFAIHAGKLKGVDDHVADWGWAFSDKDRPMTFFHLANMTSGYACDEPPGAAWNYNDYAIQLYALTLQRVFRKSLNEAALEHLAPLQFEDGAILDNRNRVMTTPRDFARIGWFWMNHGRWGGRQLLPAKFFERYMKPQAPLALPLSKTHQADDYLKIGSYGGVPKPTSWGPGKYGFNWWFNRPEAGSDHPILPDAPADMVMTIGRGGNYMIMMPSQDLLVAGRGDWGHPMPGAQRDKFNANLKLLVEAAGGQANQNTER